MMVDLESGRNLVMRAMVQSSKTKSEGAMLHQLFPTGGTVEDKDKAGEELNATIAGTGPNTFLKLLDGTVHYMVDNIDNRQQTKANCFKVVSLCGPIEGLVTVSFSCKVKVMKGFSQVRNLFKTELETMAKLRPRGSECRLLQWQDGVGHWN